jgi:hypothetical protein
LNKILPSVVIPPDGISPNDFKAPVAGPRANVTPEATPASTAVAPAPKATAPAKPPPPGKH